MARGRLPKLVFVCTIDGGVCTVAEQAVTAALRVKRWTDEAESNSIVWTIQIWDTTDSMAGVCVGQAAGTITPPDLHTVGDLELMVEQYLSVQGSSTSR